MTDQLEAVQSRRALLRSALIFAGSAGVSACVSRSGVGEIASAPAPVVPVPQPAAPVMVAAQPRTPTGVRPELLQRAMAALDRHAGQIERRDRIAIADFSVPSHRGRFHLVDLEAGKTRTLLVAHGIGSDPEHTGMLQRFSNDVGSEATSEGAFLAANYYVGKHELSQRLVGLDPTNYNALDRAIVVHAAWYANADMIAKHGKLGRSQGCFAVGERELDVVFGQLGQGRMIYAAKV